MADYKFGDGIKTVLLAGIGAVAATAEKTSEVVDDLVKKGELTVDQGKELNQELKHSVKSTISKKAEDGNDIAGMADKISTMTSDELEDLKVKIEKAQAKLRAAADKADAKDASSDKKADEKDTKDE